MIRFTSFLLPLLFLNVTALSGNVLKSQVTDLDGNRIALSSQSDYKGLVFVFLSPECPLSRNYTSVINDIQEKFKEDSIGFYLVFSGKDFSLQAIQKFKQKYLLTSSILLDPKYQLAKSLHASVTPECFVYSLKQEVVYAGAIDNWVIKLGQQRKTASNHYLTDALQSFLSNKPVEITRTTAFGCFLESK